MNRVDNEFRNSFFPNNYIVPLGPEPSFLQSLLEWSIIGIIGAAIAVQSLFFNPSEPKPLPSRNTESLREEFSAPTALPSAQDSSGKRPSAGMSRHTAAKSAPIQIKAADVQPTVVLPSENSQSFVADPIRYIGDMRVISNDFSGWLSYQKNLGKDTSLSFMVLNGTQAYYAREDSARSLEKKGYVRMSRAIFENLQRQRSASRKANSSYDSSSQKSIPIVQPRILR